MKNEEIKKMVKEKYGQLAAKSMGSGRDGCCCGCSSISVMGQEYSIFSESYVNLEGYNPDADLGLGCGIPTEYAGIRAGDTVLDLGSGAGNDCFVARSLAGENGKVVGLDFTEEMILKARGNKQKMGYTNVDFILGDIEDMPIDDDAVDVVISNCVLNLVPDKGKAFSEIYRVMKSGGHFCVSDIVLQGQLPASIRKVAALYAGCVSGAMDRQDYLDIIERQGFTDIMVLKDRQLQVPDDLLLQYISKRDLDEYRSTRAGIYSITVYAKKVT